LLHANAAGRSVRGDRARRGCVALMGVGLLRASCLIGAGLKRSGGNAGVAPAVVFAADVGGGLARKADPIVG